jgi:tRNA-2-methylthio-N6-dimethylallyladenosine synthase
MEHCEYDMSYMYFYSERPGTLAAKRYTDDIPEPIKKRRLQEIVDMQGVLSTASNQKDVGSVFEVLVEGNSRKNENDWTGRTSQNKVLVFPKTAGVDLKGKYAQVKVTGYTRTTLLGEQVV